MIRKIVLGLTMLMASSMGFCGTATGTFTVTATVSASCSVTTAALAFGTIGTPLGANQDAQSNVNITCGNGAPYSISLNQGSGTGATVAARLLTSGANTLSYALYLDSSRSQLWGDSTHGTSVVSGVGSGTTQALTVYGRIPTGSSPAAGTYNDTITVTVSF